MKSIMSNIHILTGVASFVRWPLNLHLLAQEAKKAWDGWIKQSDDPERPGLQISTDIVDETTGILQESEPAGIHALALDYTPIKEYVQKAQHVVAFEKEGNCIHCDDELPSKEGLHAMCPNEGCEAMGHLGCWSKHALTGEGNTDAIIPSNCRCPSCGGEVRWGDMIKELTLRVRGEEEVQRLLTVKKRPRKMVHE
jgi:structure-specific endonuclease subunit SLX1